MPKDISLERGMIKDEKTGLHIPRRMLLSRQRKVPPKHALDSDVFIGGGERLRTDEKTGALIIPEYASGYDDIAMNAIVRGYVKNINSTPVIDVDLSTLIAKRQAMASTWTILLNGKRAPVKRFEEVLAQANDSLYGPSEFIREYIGALDVQNRGAFFAQLPIEQIPFDYWDQYGMIAEPVLTEGQSESSSRWFILKSSNRDFRENRGLWAIDGMLCSPTGNPFWPYWIKAFSQERRKVVWVLIHRDFGGQVIQQVGARDSNFYGYGQSGVWRYMGVLAEVILVQRMNIEALIAQPPRGIVHASGMDYAGQLEAHLESFKTKLDEEKVLIYPSVMFTETTSDRSKIALVKWAEPPAGYTPKEWRDHVIDVLVATFHLSLAQMRTRLGEGSLNQADITDAIQSETGIAWMRHMISQVFNYLAPPRVTVTVSSISDRQKRYQIETFDTFTQGIKRMQEAGPDEEPVLTAMEIRNMVAKFTGITVPTEAESEQDTLQFRFVLGDVNDIPELPAETSAELNDEQIAAWLSSVTDIAFFDEFIFDEETNLYTNGEEVVALSQLIEIRNDLAQTAMLVGDFMGQDLVNESVTIDRFVVNMRQMIQQVIVTQFVLGRGGPDFVSDADQDILNEIVQIQYEYLQNFANSIIVDNIEGQIPYRSSLYGSSSVSGFELGRSLSFGVILPAYPGDGSSECKAGDRCYWDIRNGENGTVLAYWVRSATRDSCPTCLSRSIEWNPLTL